MSERSFYFKTISGQLILLNLGVFVYMCLLDWSLFSPSPEVLIAFGAKDSVAIASGEWWRFFAANFVHFGIIHLAFNCFALKIIGPQIEGFVGKFWFLIIYFFSGISAFISSSYFNLPLSCGASGAIFGLIGVGVVIEMLYHYHFIKQKEEHEKPTTHRLKDFIRQRPYLSIALINILLALVLNILAAQFLVPIRIDNGAHMGGLFSGAAFFYFIVVLKRKHSLLVHKLRGAIPFISICIMDLMVAYSLLYTPVIKDRYLEEAKYIKNPPLAYYYYSQVLTIDPRSSKARFERGRLLFLNGEYKTAMVDFSFVLEDSARVDDFYRLIEELMELKRTKDALFLQSTIEKNIDA